MPISLQVGSGFYGERAKPAAIGTSGKHRYGAGKRREREATSWYPTDSLICCTVRWPLSSSRWAVATRSFLQIGQWTVSGGLLETTHEIAQAHAHAARRRFQREFFWKFWRN
ncbi:MAG TPA: hypothetical protein VMH31_03035 [Methylomirabilota bacterium]|nr:hypothetical protein [Methylomirabilota bacterium]